MSFEDTGYRDTRILPENVEQDLKQWANGTVGWVLMGLSVFGWLSILTWSARDMHLGLATRELRNLFGPPGAVFSDFFINSLGLAAMFLFLPIFVWGLKMKTKAPIRNFKQRLVLLPLSVVLIAGACGVIPTAESWPLKQGYGGIFGDLVFGLTTNFIASFKPAFADYVACVLLTLTGATAFLSAMELRYEDVSEACKVDIRRTKVFARIIGAPARLIKSVIGGTVMTLKVFSDTFTRTKREANDGGYAGGYAPSMSQPPAAPTPASMPPEVNEAAPVSAPYEDDEIELPRMFRQNEQQASGNDARSLSEDHVQEPPFDEAEAGRRIAERFAPNADTRPRAKVKNVAPAAGPQSAQSTGGFFGLARQPAQAPKGRYQRPPIEMLKTPGRAQARAELSESVLRGNAGLLQDVLGDFGIDGKIIDIKPGPVVTLFEFEPARGVKSSRVIALADDIARSMSAVSARVAVVPGRNVIGIELPNMKRDTVYLSELFTSDAYTKAQHALPMALGKNIAGNPVVVDLARMPHLLIAGTTGSGKSVGINAMILSLLYSLSPDQCKFIMIDPKMLELSVYNDIPHLLAPVVTDPQKAVGVLNWVIREMEERYKNMSQLGVRNINAYNDAARGAQAEGRKIARQVHTGYHPETRKPIYEEQHFAPEVLPYIVVVVDELADLMIVAGKEIEGALQRLAQMARAAGIHLIMATQRPSVDVVTGTIKSNFPTRISFKVASKIDSRTILAETGAEQLLGHGDMLYSTGPGQMNRIHGPLVEDTEVEKIIGFLRAQGQPNYVESLVAVEAPREEPQGPTGKGGSNDELYERAVAIVLRDRKVSTSYIQRRLSIGYNRAADIIDRMEAEGLISAPDRTGKRKILMGESEDVD